MQAFLHVVNSQPIKNSDGDFNDLLAWRSVNEHMMFPTPLANLARAFLAIPIPATSTASASKTRTRIWSRASQYYPSGGPAWIQARTCPAHHVHPWKQPPSTHVLLMKENNRLLHMYYLWRFDGEASRWCLPSSIEVEVEGYWHGYCQHDHFLLFWDSSRW